jgi:hypothetical protein
MNRSQSQRKKDGMLLTGAPRPDGGR